MILYSASRPSITRRESKWYNLHTMPILNPEVRRYFPPYVTRQVTDGVLYMDATLSPDVQTALTTQFMGNDRMALGQRISQAVGLPESKVNGMREMCGFVRVIEAAGARFVMKKLMNPSPHKEVDDRYWMVRRGQEKQEETPHYPEYMRELQAVFTAMALYEKQEGEPLPIEKPLACFVNRDPETREQWILFEFLQQSKGSTPAGKREKRYASEIFKKLEALGITREDYPQSIRTSDGKYVLIDTAAWRVNETDS